MIPQKTLLHGTIAGDYNKQLTVDKWVYETLKEWSNDKIRKMTKGIVLYECMMMQFDSISDTLTQSESAINDKLENQSINPELVDAVTQIEFEDAEDELKKNVESPDEKRKDVKFWVPEFVDESVPWMRGWNNHIQDAIVQTYASAFSDRSDRIEAKQQLLDYIISDSKPEHPVANVIVSADENDFNVPTELTSIFIDSWWNRDDITISDITELQDSDNTRLKNTDWDKRNKAFATALEGIPASENRRRARNLYEDIFNISSKKTLNKHFSEFEDNLDYEFKSAIEAVDAERVGLIDDLPESKTAFGVDTEKKVACLINKVLKNHIEQEMDTTIPLRKFAENLDKAGCISINSDYDKGAATSKTGEYIKRLDEEFGLDFKYIKQAKVYTSLHM
ncbi:hypothetical protein [Haloarcula argentinensis]|uniref:Uncharacterized protein n=1 Tax=Haloarcula argentinensis TaxID=43776 RepID=A0A847U1R3_HALAR|nr:hypothetical protein [Haloarcula argentinensis]NLV12202.1 hypothetical protein [Haloarcula argentinensis]